MKWVVLAAMIAAASCGGYAYVLSVQVDALQARVEELTRQVAAYKRLRDADIGRGDAADDASWLCKRAGRKDCP